MEPKERDLLNRTFEYSRENNKILKKMRSSMRWGRFFRIIYWGIIITGTIWGFYYLEPYISNLVEIYGNIGLDSLK